MRTLFYFLLGLAIAVVLANPAEAGVEAEPPALVITALKTEYAENPLGLDVMRPRLSWQFAAHRRAQRQTAYRILAASGKALLDQDTGDLWDSGRVSSDQSVQVVYEGEPLQSGRRYYWKVQASDQDGTPTPWSDAAWWEMGLLQPATLNVTVSPNTTATVHVPADGRGAVTEGYTPAEEAEGVAFLRMEDGYALYEVGSGKYRFTGNTRGLRAEP